MHSISTHCSKQNNMEVVPEVPLLDGLLRRKSWNAKHKLTINLKPRKQPMPKSPLDRSVRIPILESNFSSIKYFDEMECLYYTPKSRSSYFFDVPESLPSPLKMPDLDEDTIQMRPILNPRAKRRTESNEDAGAVFIPKTPVTRISETVSSDYIFETPSMPM